MYTQNNQINYTSIKTLKNKNVFKKKCRDFPGGPVVGTPCFHCRGRGFKPWSGN